MGVTLNRSLLCVTLPSTLDLTFNVRPTSHPPKSLHSFAPFLLAPHLIQLPHQRTSPHLTSPHLTSPHLTFNGTHAKEEDIEYQDTRRNCEQTADNTNTTTK